MGKIQELPEDLVNQIAAGEVIESPASILKECLENSLDAKAKRIEILTKDAGLSMLLISDDGEGIEKSDLPLALLRHATSKIRDFRDLEKLGSFGFRGEALASIASVSRLTISSGIEGDRFAFQIQDEDLDALKELPHFQGTKILIEDLFHNTPVRRKFLRSQSGEEKRNRHIFQTMAIGSPDVGFSFTSDGKTWLDLYPESRFERILSVFGQNLRPHLLPLELEDGQFKIQGFISHPDFYRSNRSGQYFFVNGRAVDLKFSSSILRKCFGELLPMGAHPYAFLYLDLPQRSIDVNVHPQKKEVRFLSDDLVTQLLFRGIQSVLRDSTPIALLEMRQRLSMPWNTPKSAVEDNTKLGFEMPVTTNSRFSLEGIAPGIHLNALTDNPKQNKSFVPKTHFGILFETFILAEAEDGLYIIDQHTAHERIRYEEVLRDLSNKAYQVQKLLTPIRIELTKADAEEILQQKEYFQEVGIQLEPFEGGTVLVSEVPTYLTPGKEIETVLDFWNRTKTIRENQLFDEMAKCVACRSAVKKGDQISNALIAELLQRLSYCENPSLCPHGRPTLLKLTKDDLEKLFHRK